MATIFLFAMMLIFMLQRVWLPLGTRTEGKVEKTMLLSLQEKSLLQRVNIYAIGFVMLLTAVTGVIDGTVEIMIVLVALGIMSMPVRVYITASGIGLSNVLYRPWSEFAAFSVEKRRIVLSGKDGLRSFSLPLLNSHQRELIPLLRRHLPEAKAGQVARVGKRKVAL